MDEKDLVDDDEMDDMVSESNQNEQCIICEDFGKDGEIWFRCVICGLWVHSECSGKDSPANYECDFCLKKVAVKRRIV